MLYADLNDRSILALSGDDRIAFLQGIITQDAELLKDRQMLYAAMLSPQGKFLHDFFLVPQGEKILIDVNKERTDDLQKRLTMYKLRSKITLEALPQIKVRAVWEANAANSFPDPRLPALGARLYGERFTNEGQAGDYELHRIRLGIPDGAKDMVFEKSLLLEFSFESLNGVSFSKGCYVGQEVTARSKFRGQVRKRIYKVEGNAALPPLGTPVEAGGVALGELRTSSSTHGLAILRSEELAKTNTPVTAAGVVLTCKIPEWDKTSD